jgi:hypothetical protein
VGPRGFLMGLDESIRSFPAALKLAFLREPSCLLWFKHLNFINHKGHKAPNQVDTASKIDRLEGNLGNFGGSKSRGRLVE